MPISANPDGYIEFIPKFQCSQDFFIAVCFENKGLPSLYNTAQSRQYLIHFGSLKSGWFRLVGFMSPLVPVGIVKRLTYKSNYANRRCGIGESKIPASINIHCLGNVTLNESFGNRSFR